MECASASSAGDQETRPARPRSVLKKTGMGRPVTSNCGARCRPSGQLGVLRLRVFLGFARRRCGRWRASGLPHHRNLTCQPDAPTAALEGRWDPTMRFFSSPAVLLLDGLGYLPMPSEDADALFRVISRRCRTGSVILTTNRNVASGETSSQTAPSPLSFSTSYSTRASCSSIPGDSYRLRAYHAQARRNRPKRDQKLAAPTHQRRGVSLADQP